MTVFARDETLFAQGDASKNIMYIQKRRGEDFRGLQNSKEAVVGMLGPGDFIGEGGLAGQSLRMATATAMAP